MTEENLVEKVEIYEVQWGRNREEYGVATESGGFYLTHAVAENVLAKIRKGMSWRFDSGEVVPREVIRVGDKMYKIDDNYQIPNTFADPSRLEEITDHTAVLDLGEGLIVTITTEPLKVKKRSR